MGVDRKIAVMFNKPGVFPGFENVVSAHIQLPLKTAKLLQDNNRDCLVVTTQIPKNQVAPNCFNDISSNSVLFVSDLNKQGERSAALEGQVKGVRFRKFVLNYLQVVWALKKNKINVLQVFGTKKFILLAILYKIFCPSLKLIWTTENKCKKSSKIIELLIDKAVDTIVTTTEYVQSTLGFHKDVRLIRPGVARIFNLDSSATKKRVLFWRDPSVENGADIALKVFKALASKYEDILFTFAVRPHWNTVVSENDCDAENIEYYEYPYKNISLDQLLSESVAVLFPFRELSTNPQLAVIETLNAGVPVICSSVESNAEILRNCNLDFRLFDEVDKYTEELDKVLEKFVSSGEVDQSSIQKLEKFYNWSSYIKQCQDVYQ